MKNLILLAMLGLGLIQSQVFADGIEFGTSAARCTFKSAEFMTVTYEFSGFFGIDGAVKINGAGDEIILAANNGMSSWISYSSSFKLDGKDIKLEFANYYSPSIGTLTVNNENPQPIACQLLDKITQGKLRIQAAKIADSDDFCQNECGRSCLTQPLFCGQW